MNNKTYTYTPQSGSICEVGVSPFKIEEAVIPPKHVPQAPPSVDKACIAHEEAYKAVFGVVPKGYTYHIDTRMIQVGDEAGVSLLRLKELTRMLKARV